MSIVDCIATEIDSKFTVVVVRISYGLYTVQGDSA